LKLVIKHEYGNAVTTEAFDAINNYLDTIGKFNCPSMLVKLNTRGNQINDRFVALFTLSRRTERHNRL
jgi:hypothetical protein